MVMIFTWTNSREGKKMQVVKIEQQHTSGAAAARRSGPNMFVVKFLTVVTYAPGIFPFICVARFVAELVNPNEPARYSPRQKILFDRQKICFAFKKVS